MFEVNHTQWLKLMNAVLDQSPVRAEAVFCHGWGDLHDEMIAYCSQLYRESGAKYLVLNGTREYEKKGKGFPYWLQRLTNDYSINRDAIYDIGEALQTAQEAEGFISFAKEHDIKKAILCSVPQHMFRAFLTNIGFIQQMQVSLQLIPRTLPRVNWNERIIVRGLYNDVDNTTRIGRFASELARVVEYRQRAERGEQGFVIASVADGLKHLQIE